MICIAILTVVVSSLAVLYPQSIMVLDTSEQRLKAESLAASIMSDLRTGGYTGITARLGQPRFKHTLVAGNERFQVFSEAFAVAGENPARIVGARVIVEWTERTKNQSLTRELFLAKVAR